MANKKFRLGMLILALIMALVFGTAVIGCDTAASAGANNGSAGPVEPDDITYTVTADGAPDKETSTQLTFTFSAEVELISNNITITGVTGNAGKNVRAFGGILTGGGTEWILNITDVTPGKIRIRIDKDGIERGRKTVTVYKDSATGEESTQAITLKNTIWEEGRLEGKADVRWYKFEAESGTDYRVQWKDKNGVNIATDRIYVTVTVWRSDLTMIEDFNEDGQGVFTSAPLPRLSGTVYLKVETKDNSPGTFAVRFFDPANMGPLDKITIYKADAMPNLSVELAWGVSSANYPNPIESTGYKVYRSDTKDGTPTEIADVPESSTDPSSYNIYTDTDTDLTVGKTYWYTIAGYNSKGEVGDKSEPRESELLFDVEAGTLLTVGGPAEDGEFTISHMVDWYKFTAEPGKNYEISREGSIAMFDTYGFKSDKTPISELSTSTFSGLSGTVYLKAVFIADPRNNFGPYHIKVQEYVPWWEQ